MQSSFFKELIDDGCGSITVVLDFGSRDLVPALVGLGLTRSKSQEELIAISGEVARNILTELFAKDLAHSIERMPMEKAESYAVNLLEFIGTGASFYTNGRWDQYHSGKMSGWNSCYLAAYKGEPTFGACLIALTERLNVAVCVCDED